MARKPRSKKDEEYQGDIPSQCTRAVKFVQKVEEAEGANRKEAIDDARFRAGEQWPVEIQNSRQLEARPLITINKTNAFCQHLVNNYRQQRPRIRIHPVGDGADVKKAKILQGLVRHIEVQSDADTAYDTGVDSEITIGWGYWRVIHDYSRPDSFDQELYIRAIPNTFSVHFDTNSMLLDGSDAEEVCITEDIPRETFKAYYPEADDGANFIAGNVRSDFSEWVTQEIVRVCEHFYTERTLETLFLLSDGTTMWEKDFDEKIAKKIGLSKVSDRQSFRKKIMWSKVSALDVLEEREWPGRWIPVIPAYGNVSWLTGRKVLSGAVRQAKDPARMYNFWRTAMTESVALAPKAKWLLADGQDEGFENEWAQANIKATPVLHYKQVDSDGRQAPRPERLQPEPPPSGAMESAMAISEDLQSVLGITDSAARISGNVSGKALNSSQQQTDIGNFHFFDNATKSQAHTGRILVDLIPRIYDTKRVIRIIGDDNKPSMVTINDPEEKDAVGQILNDVTVGEYDVIMETGPGFNSKRQEAVEAMMPMMSANEELFKTAGDLFFRNMDFPGADIIADRLAAANPLAQIDDKSPVPPQIQMKLKAQEQQIQQLTGQLQAAAQEIKTRGSIEQMKQDGETKRELMKQHTKAHDTETIAATKRLDVEMRSMTALDVAGLDSHTRLAEHHLSGQQAREQQAFDQSQIDSIHDEMNQ